jgi:predicted permease
MENFVLVFICMAFGKLARRAGLVPDDAYRTVNVWVLYIAIPALALRFIPNIVWDAKMLLPVAGPFLLWTLAWVFFRVYARAKGLDNATRVVLLVCCGLGNTGFLGFPLVTAFYGFDGLAVAIVFDLGVFILFCTVGTFTVLNAAGRSGGVKIHPLRLLQKMLSMPPSVAILCALILPRFVDIAALNPLLDKLIPTVAPMAMFSIGLQLEFKECGRHMGHISAGLFFKLIFSPLLIMGIALLMGVKGLTAQASVLQAGVGAHVTMSLMAAQFNLNPRLCGLLVGFSILGALCTAPLLWWVMERLF